MASAGTLVIFAATVAKVFSYSHSDAVRLKNDIFFNYSKDIRPMRNQSEAIVIWFDLYFINIKELDMLTQMLISSGWHNLSWRDEYLTWDPSEYGGLEEFYVSQDEVWLPDLSFYNTKPSAAGRVIGSQSRMMVRIFYEGLIRWEPDFSLESTCKVDITRFPFDIQTCQVEFCSWAMPKEALQIRIKQPNPDFMLYALRNGEFSTDGYSCWKGTWTIDMTICSLTLTRRVNFYIFSLLIPLVLLSFLSLVSFMVPTESGEKLTVSMTTLLSFTVYLGVLDSVMPKTSDTVSILMTYVTMLMAISLLSVAGNATVMILYYRGRDQSKPRNTEKDADSHDQHDKIISLLPLSGKIFRRVDSCPEDDEQSMCSCLALVWNREKLEKISMTSTKQPGSVEISRTVNKLFFVVLSIILFLTMVCIAALFVYS